MTTLIRMAMSAPPAVWSVAQSNGSPRTCSTVPLVTRSFIFVSSGINAPAITTVTKADESHS